MIILLFSACTGEGIDGLRDGQIRPEQFPFIYISNICDEESSDYEEQTIEFTCAEFEKLGYFRNPPEVCEEITVTGSDGKTYTGLFVYAQFYPECQ